MDLHGMGGQSGSGNLCKRGALRKAENMLITRGRLARHKEHRTNVSIPNPHKHISLSQELLIPTSQDYGEYKKVFTIHLKQEVGKQHQETGKFRLNQLRLFVYFYSDWQQFSRKKGLSHNLLPDPFTWRCLGLNLEPSAYKECVFPMSQRRCIYLLTLNLSPSPCRSRQFLPHTDNAEKLVQLFQQLNYRIFTL